MQLLDKEEFPPESLADLRRRPELADWLAARPSAGPASESIAGFRQCLVKIRSLRQDLDSHPFFQANRLELLQRQLGPRQLLLAFCPTGQQMMLLGVDRQRTYVHEFHQEGDWIAQQLVQTQKSTEARSYVSSRLIAPFRAG